MSDPGVVIKKKFSFWLSTNKYINFTLLELNFSLTHNLIIKIKTLNVKLHNNIWSSKHYFVQIFLFIHYLFYEKILVSIVSSNNRNIKHCIVR